MQQYWKRTLARFAQTAKPQRVVGKVGRVSPRPPLSGCWFSPQKVIRLDRTLRAFAPLREIYPYKEAGS